MTRTEVSLLPGALRAFLADPASTDLWRELDGFVGPHGHRAIDRPRCTGRHVSRSIRWPIARSVERPLPPRARSR